MTVSPSNVPIRIEVADTDNLFDQIFSIREEVFVEETEIEEEEEYDGMDHLSTHFIAFWEEEAAATARLYRIPGSGKMRIARLAVRKAFRKKGVGTALLTHLLTKIPKGETVVIHSLIATIPFFEKIGFQVLGETFEEAGLPHVEMNWSEQFEAIN